MTPRHDLRLIPAAVVAWSCAAAATTGLTHLGWLACGMLVALAALACLGPRAWVASLLVPALAGAAAMLCAAVRLERETELVAVAGSGHGTVVGVLASDPRPRDAAAFTGEEQVLLTLNVSRAAVTGSDPASTGGEALLIAPAAWGAALSAGDEVSVDATWEPAGRGRAVAIGWDPTLRRVSRASGVARLVDSLRDSFRAATAGLGDETRGLVRGMVIGDRSEMSEVQSEEMKAAGLTHLTAVSGTHLSIVAGLLGLGLRRLRMHRVASVAGLALGMSAFAVLVLPQPSVIRALGMALVGGLGALWGRPAQAMPALASVTIVLLCVDPYLALEPGLVLSVSAVTGIVLLAPVIRRRLAPVLGGMAATAVSIPTAAQLACGPTLALLAPSVSIWAVPANIAAVPFAAPVVALGTVTVVLGGVAAPLASPVAALTGLLSIPIARIAHLCAGLPGAAVSWADGVVGVLLAALVLAGAAAAAHATAPRIRVAAVGVALLAVAVGAGPRLGDGAASVPDDWSVVACDVGQGDMTVARAGPRSAVVVDTGPGGGAAECLTRLGVDDVPLLVLSHPHADHDGAITEIAEVARLGAVWWSAAAEGPAGARAADALTAAGTAPQVPESGDRVAVGTATVTVLPTDGTLGHSAPGADDESAVNDASLALLVSTEGVSALLLGDLEADAQHALAAAMGPLSVDAIKVAHHGSSSQDPELASQVDAAVALISVGEDNTYGHPTASALALYSEGGTPTVRTDECGTIALWRDGGLVVASGCPTAVAG